MSFCAQCGARLAAGSRFCSKCGAPVKNVDTQPNAAGNPGVTDRTSAERVVSGAKANTAQRQEQVLYQGVCLRRLNGMNTVGGDCVITPGGLYYYERKGFRNQIGKRPCDYCVPSGSVREIKTSRKNANDVMELYMHDGTVLEFYSPQFSQMLAAMKSAVNMSR